MKRAGGQPAPYGGPKKARGGDSDDDFGGSQTTFEEDLMAMDEYLDDPELLADLDGSPEHQEKRWARPSAENYDPKTTDLAFQWMDIDMYSAREPLRVNPSGAAPVGSLNPPVPIVRMYGVTQDGRSVLAHIHGFTPYFYVALPPSADLSDSALMNLRKTLDLKCREKARSKDEKECKDCILGINKVVNKQSIFGYQFSASRDFIIVYCALPSMVPSLKRMFDDGVYVGGATVRGHTYESNVPFVLRFMIDNNIQGSDWIEIPAGKYSVRGPSAQKPFEKTSHCTLEVDFFFNELVAHPCDTPRWSSLAPMRILSFDIECMGRKGHFPEPEIDPVIQIASTVTLQGSDHPIIRNVFTLNTCLPIVGAQVICSQTEEEMLLKWRDFVVACDPDIITGYNIANFDFPYLLKRARKLAGAAGKPGYNKSMEKFAFLGRVIQSPAVMRDTTFQSSAYGKRESVETELKGRVIFDVLPYMFRNHKLSSYSLNSVSAEFLGQQKEDVHHSIISDLQMGSDADRRRLAVYCLKDAYLPQQLLNKLSVIVNLVEMARVTGVPLNYLSSRGQQIKVFSMILRKCRRENLLIPNIAKHGNEADAGYEGATVIEPKKAYYEVPIATLDFASLYPSIMQAYNLCYSTMLTEADAQRLPADSYQKTPAGHLFVKATTRKGILPQILDELLAARKRAKKDMGAATDPMEKAVQNGRQLALKVSANSVYGFTGATVGQLPCVAIASSVTSYGRTLLLDTRTFVESHYTVANGYQYNADVVYGDTDSVMVNFGPPSVAEAMPLALKAAEEVSKIFPPPIKLEFEKVYFPYLLMNKKRYAGLLWTSPEKYDKLDAKGLETVRRDNCLLVRRMVDTCLRKILIDRNVQGAIDFAKNTISDLLQNKMDISMLVITKSLGKSADDADYASKQAHVELAMRMKKRDPGTAPNVGDRVAYVIVQAAKGAPAYEKSEDPVYVLDHNLPIDTEYYLSNQLSGPLQRIFEPIIANPTSLLSGDHTRTVCKPTPTAKPGGIMMFAVKSVKCMGCKTLISEKDKAGNDGAPLCSNCAPKEGEIYMQKLQDVNTHQQVFTQLWTECQRCQGSFHQDVICSNRDCPIFYKRKKVQIDLAQATEQLERFQW